MTNMRSLHLRVLAAALFAAASVAPSAMAQAAPEVRIVTPIDESNLVTLRGNVHPAAIAKNDRGPVSADLVMGGLTLVLSRSAEQQTAFDAFVASQYDQSSPNFHQWLAPQQVGERFGPAQADVSTLASWLASQGFAVKNIGADRMTIQFTGTAGQVESAFHTQIHNLSVNGVAHIANMTDPQIPAALTPVVLGVKGLHNFLPHPLHKVGSKVQFNPDARGWTKLQGSSASHSAPGAFGAQAKSASSPKPNFYFPYSGSTAIEEDVAPFDFAKIYNLPSTWPTSNSGSGQTITVIGTSDLYSVSGAYSDIANFKSAFGLPAGLAPIIAHGPDGDPGVCTGSTNTCNGGDLDENSLDVEWSGAVAPGAQIVLVTDAYNNQNPELATNDPIFDGAQWAITNAYTSGSAVYGSRILSISYGECELYNGTASNVAYHNLWQTAASAGIAVFTATGDSGSPSCDQNGDANGYPYEAQYGVSVSGLASSPYDTAVGGTDLNWCGLTQSNGTITGCASSNATAYWNTSNNSTTQASAKGYVPEIPWNDTCLNPAIMPIFTGYADQLGVTVPTNTEAACNFVYNQWVNIADDTNGDLILAPYIDAVGGGGGISSCVVNTSTSTVGTCNSTDTSTGSTYGNLTLVNDGWPKPSWQTSAASLGVPADGVRDLPDVSFFAGNGLLDSATLICVANDDAACTSISETGNGVSADTGGAEEVGGTSVATPQMAGVMALINEQTGATQGNPNAALYALAAKQTYASCKAETGTTSNGCYFNDIDTGTISMPCDYQGDALEGGAIYGSGGWQPSATYPGLASPNCSALNSGDVVGTLSGYSATTGYDQATGLGSLNIANVVNAPGVWTATATGSDTATVTVSPASGSITPNESLSVTITVAGSDGTATGTVTLSSGSYTSTATALSSGSATIVIPADSLTGTGNPFTATLTAAYTGDSTYAAAIGTAKVTVTKLNPTSVLVVPTPTAINSNESLSVGITVTVANGDPAPTGTVVLSGGGYISPATTLSGGTATIVVPASSFTASGNVTLGLVYSGDENYNSATGSNQITVTQVTVVPATVTVAPTPTTVDSSQPLSVVVTTNSTAVGTITLTGGGYTSSAVTLSSGSASFTIPGGTFTTYGTVTLTASYAPGTGSLFSAATGSANITVNESDYTVTVPTAPTAISSPGGSSTATVSVTGANDYAGTVSLTCTLATATSTDAPTCTATSGSSVTLSSGTTTGSVSFTVGTTSASAAVVTPSFGKGTGKGLMGAGGGALLAMLVFFGIPARRRSWRAMLGMLVLLAALGSLSACGGSVNNSGGGGNTGTPTGTYTFNVTATGSPTVTPVPSTSFSVTLN